MNYFFVHLGNYPYWLKDSINSVNISDKNANIFLCGNSNEKIDGVNNIHLNDIASYLTLESMKSELWKNDKNPLWRTSIYRIFILLDMMRTTKVQDFVHFDSDVILFQSFENAKKSINQDIKSLHITPCNDTELVFGYSYCNCIKSLEKICIHLIEAMYNENLLLSLINGHPNEMQILSGIQKKLNGPIVSLPIIPNKSLEYIFDPSSYGQYLFGTHNGHAPGWHGNHHYIGKLINTGKLQVNMDIEPLATNDETTCKIINLHIHSKKTQGIKR